jgi:hypothetical protein
VRRRYPARCSRFDIHGVLDRVAVSGLGPPGRRVGAAADGVVDLGDQERQVPAG